MAIIAFVAVLDGVNVLTILHDAARRGQTLRLWEPITLEYTSGLAEVAACGLIYLALRRAPPGQSAWAPTLLIHAAASLVFSALHVGGMTLLRMAVCAAMNRSYHLAVTDLPYEYRKDLMAYVILGGMFWLFARPTSQRTRATPSPAAFDIRDGARTVRTPVSEILALRAAGNYVEFLLRDGRRPLMRGALRKMEASLSPMGFLRTHRSWIVNESGVAGVRSAGSGDFQIQLHGGAEAPLSRRFKSALTRLRGPLQGELLP